MMTRTAQNISYTVNVVTVLYFTFLMLVIGYGLDAYNSFGIGRITPDQGHKLLADMIQDDGNKNGGGDDVQERLVMAILVNIRINMMAWTAIWFTSIYGLLIPFQQRAPIHVLGFFANVFTLSLHLWHMAGGDDSMVPKDDPYHRIPLPFDGTVAALNLMAFFVVLLESRRKKKSPANDKSD